MILVNGSSVFPTAEFHAEYRHSCQRTGKIGWGSASRELTAPADCASMAEHNLTKAGINSTCIMAPACGLPAFLF